MTLLATDRWQAASLVRHGQRGTSLIEVLVSMVVATLALLGMAKLQSLSINQTLNADAQSRAALAVENLASMMKANPGFWKSASLPDPMDIVVDSLNATALSGVGADVLVSATRDCQATGSCSTEEMAAFDLHTLGDQLGKMMSGGTMRIQRLGSALPPSFRVVVSWNEKSMTLGGNETRYGAGIATASYQVLVRP